MIDIIPKLTKTILCFIIIFILSSYNLIAQETKENAEFKLAVNLYNDGMMELALDQFRNFTNNYPNSNQSIESRFYIGLCQMKLQRYDDARITFQNFALNYTDHPKAAESWFKVGEAYGALKNNREAALAFERVKVFYPRSPIVSEALLKSSEYYKLENDKLNSEKNLRYIVQEHSNSEFVSAARLLLAEFYFEEGNIDLASSELKKVIESGSRYKPKALILIGKIQQELGQHAEAEQSFSQVITGYKNTKYSSLANLELGKLLRQSNEHLKAIDYFKKAISEKDIDAEVKENAILELGYCYYELNDFQKSSEYFENFIKTFTNSEKISDAMLWAGKSAEMSGKYRTSLNWYDKILESPKYEPVKPYVYIRASYSAEKNGMINQAIEYCNGFIQNFPENKGKVNALIRIGDLYKNNLKDYKQAIISYEDALRTPAAASKISALKLTIADCYNNIGNWEEASRIYEEIINYFPSDVEGLAAIEKLELIKIFEGRDTKAGLEKIAKLIGDILSNKSKGELFYNLAEIYFYDLKDYNSAAEYYNLSISEKINEPDLQKAYFNKAKALEYLAMRDNSVIDQTINAYENLLLAFPTTTYKDDAAFNLLTLKIKESSNESIEKVIDQNISKNPKSSNIDRIYKLLGDVYYENRRYNEALSIYERIIKEFPNSELVESVLNRSGIIYLNRGDYNSANSVFQKQLIQFPKGLYTASSLKFLGISLLKQEKPSEAVNVLRTLIEDFYYTEISEEGKKYYIETLLNSNQYEAAILFVEKMLESENINPFIEEINYDLILNLAKAYDRKGDIQKAYPLYQEYLRNAREKDDIAEVYAALGNISRNQGSIEAASAYFKLAGKSGNTVSSKKVADILFQNERYEDAARLYGNMLATAADEEEKKYFLSRIIISKLRMDDYKGATPLISEFTKNYKKSTESIAEFEYEKGLSYYRKQDYSSAKKIFEDITDDYSSTRFAPFSEFYLGKIMEFNKKIPDAIKKYEYILKKWPNSDAQPRVLLALGNINFNSEKFEDAIRYYQKIIEDQNRAGDILPFAMTNLIEAYETTKLYDAALKLARDFIDRFPKDPTITDKRIKLGILNARLGYYDQAIVHFNNLLDDVGTEYEAEIRYNLGETFYYKGDYQQAILEFLKVPYLVIEQEKIDWTATSFYMAGQSYERMGKYDQAISMYQQIIDRPGIEATFKAGAQKEIERVKSIIDKGLR